MSLLRTKTQPHNIIIRCGWVVCLLLCHTVIASKLPNTEAAVVLSTSKVVNQWLDALDNNAYDLKTMLAPDAKLDLLGVNSQQTIQQSIKQRKQSFQGGNHQLTRLYLKRASKDFSTVELLAIIRWDNSKSAIQSEVEIAKIKQIITLRYIKAAERYLISVITESYLLPSEGLESQLRC